MKGEQAMGGKYFIFFCLAFFMFTNTIGFAQDTTKVKPNKKQHQLKFVDKNGDGYNDNAPDHDGDGIPNGLDPDWLKSRHKKRPVFRDLDGDGINDLIQNRSGGNKNFLHGKRPRPNTKKPNRPKLRIGPKMRGRK